MFTSAGHVFTFTEVSLNRTPALFQATELLGDRAHAQHPEEYREDLLLPLSAVLAESSGEQRALCIHLVVSNL